MPACLQLEEGAEAPPVPGSGSFLPVVAASLGRGGTFFAFGGIQFDRGGYLVKAINALAAWMLPPCKTAMA